MPWLLPIMAIWEYKVISSGKGGFATPALLESFLNQLGGEEWEIIEFRTPVDNPLAFHGLARRLTQRDWTLEAAAAAVARAEADKVRAEFAAKFQAATTAPKGGDPSAPGSTSEAEGGGEFRRPRDTEHDQDPYALDDSTEDEVDEWPEEDQLPTFFEAIRPHMRRNQKGPGYSVGIDYLVKKFDMIEDDVVSALAECGFAIPDDEDDKPVYLEYDGDLYWLNVNRRGELWINTREKPRPVFKTVKATPVTPEPVQEKSENSGDRRQQRQQQEPREPNPGHQESRRQEQPPKPASESPEPSAEAEAHAPTPAQAHTGEPLPTGAGLLAKLRPMMRRSRGGWSGTVSYLSRALKYSDAELVAALSGVGLVPPASSGEKAPVVELDEFCYWLNRDGRGGIWINARDAKRMRSENKPAEASKPDDAPAQPDVSVTVQPGNSAEGQPASEVQAVAAATASPSVEVPKESAEVAAPSVAQVEPSAPASTETASDILARSRSLLKEGRTGSFSLEIGALASALGATPEALLSSLTSSGLKVPEKPREKPVFAARAGEIYWLNLNAKGKLWLNAKASKFASEPQSEAAEGDSSAVADEGERDGEKKKKRPSRPKKKAE